MRWKVVDIGIVVIVCWLVGRSVCLELLYYGYRSVSADDSVGSVGGVETLFETPVC